MKAKSTSHRGSRAKFRFAGYPREESAPRRSARLQNEWRETLVDSRLSAARDCSRVVRHGVGEVAAANHRHGQTVQRFLSIARLLLLGSLGSVAHSRAAGGTTNQG